MPSCIGDSGGDPEKMRMQLLQMCDQYGVDEFKSWYTDYASVDDCPEANLSEVPELTKPTEPTAPPTDPPTYSPSVYCKQEYSQEIVSVSSCDELHSYWPECVADEGGDPAKFALLLEDQCNEFGLEEYQSWYQDCADDIDKCVDNYQAAPSTAGSAVTVPPAGNVGGEANAASNKDVTHCDHDPPGCPEAHGLFGSADSKRLMERLIRGSA